MKAYMKGSMIAVAFALGAQIAAAQTPQPITLAEAVQLALSQSTDIARSDNQQALDGISVAEMKSRFLPDLSLSSSTGQSYGRSFSEGEGGLVTQTTNSMNVRLSSSVTLFDGFANSANLKGARLNAEAGAQNAVRTRQSVIMNVAAGYLAVVEAAEQLRVAEENLRTEQAREQEILQLVKAGTRTVADQFQQQATVAAAKSTVVDAQRASKSAQLDLVELIHLDPARDYAFTAPAVSPRTAAQQLPVDSLLAAGLAQRTDIAAMGASVAAAEQAVRAAKADRLPSIVASVGFGSNYSNAAVSSFIDQLSERQGGSLSLGVSIPLFDRKAASRAIERASIEVENAELAVTDLKRQVVVDIRRALLDRASAEASLEAAVARVAASKQALDVTDQRYKAGLATLFEVTQARAGLLDATSAQVRAHHTLLYQDVMLDYQTGDLEAATVLQS